jgi:hypothetical protein
VRDAVVPAECWKFHGASVRELHQDDLAFLVRVFRHDARLGRLFGDEVRRRAKLARRPNARRLTRPRVRA